MAARTVESDFDYAFELQLQEALSASLSLHQHQPETPVLETGSSSHTQNDAVLRFTDAQSDELAKSEQESDDHTVSEKEFRKLKHDIRRRIHGHRVAREISSIPDDEWGDWGDDFERPLGEGSSKSGGNSEDEDEVFRVYFNGLVDKALPKGKFLGGIGIAICDSRDGLLFDLGRKVVVCEGSKQIMGMRALVEGLNVAAKLDLKRVVYYCGYYPIYQYVKGKWPAKQRKLAELVNEVAILQEKFAYCQPELVYPKDVKFASQLARDALTSQVNKDGQSSTSRSLSETCVICLEEREVDQIFSVDGCLHRYCISCMKQHAEVKLLNGVLPKCPHEGCSNVLKIESCRKFLAPRLVHIMSQRIKEDAIPVTEKVYCPYPKCSALMSQKEVLKYSKHVDAASKRMGSRRCVKCTRMFCINCKVPWHYNMSCLDYKIKNPNPHPEERKLKNLAENNLWRQCVKCNHMIELAAGCYHMTCRCGHEFCYTCGAEWKNKKATCSCPLWDEGYIIEDELDEEDDEDGWGGSFGSFDSDSDYDYD